MPKRYKAVCPNCKSNKVVPIAYGLPGFEMREEAIKGKIHLGGCMIEDDSPDFHCNECEHEWVVVEGK